MRPAALLAAALLAVPSAAADDQDAGCPAVGAGRIEAALDQAAYTEESIVQGVSSSNSPRRIDLRFSLEQAWEPRWTCHTWEVELVLPPCVEAHNPECLTGTDVNKRAGLRNDKTHWTLKLDEAAEETGEAADAECSNHRQSSPTYQAWYKVRVLDSNSNVHVAFKDGRTPASYPAGLSSCGTGEHTRNRRLRTPVPIALTTTSPAWAASTASYHATAIERCSKQRQQPR